jgi:hypothetical protein
LKAKIFYLSALPLRYKKSRIRTTKLFHFFIRIYSPYNENTKKEEVKLDETFLLYYTATSHPFSYTRETTSKTFFSFSGS